MALAVIVLAEAEVDEHGAHPALAIAGQHDVCGLDVEMADSVLVQELDGVEYGPEQLADLLFRQGAMLGDVLVEAGAVDVLHDVVGRIVGLEDLVEADDVGVPETDLLEALGLGDEVLAGVLHTCACGIGIRDGTVAQALAVIAQEELLEAEVDLHDDGADLHGPGGAIGNAEAALAESLVYLIVAVVAVEAKALGQRCLVVVHNYACKFSALLQQMQFYLKN